MNGGTAEIGNPVGILDLFGHAFELSFTDLGKVDSVGSGSGILIKEYGDAGFFPDAFAELLGIFNGFFLCDIFKRYKRNNVDCAHSGVFAFVMIKVDKLRCFLCKSCCRVHNAFGAAHKGYNAAVMVNIAAVIQKGDACGIADGINTFFYNFVISSLTDIRDTLNDFCHFYIFLSYLPDRRVTCVQCRPHSRSYC